MTPPAGFRHSRRQDNVIGLLHLLMPKGQTLPECAVSTADGVKAVDVAWLRHDRPELHDEPLALSSAPEICIEILSPSNSVAEIAEKRALYFDAGATEVWICNLEGSFSFFVAPDHQQTISNLCPDFPPRIL
jgi:Uma2 family endonuclease